MPRVKQTRKQRAAAALGAPQRPPKRDSTADGRAWFNAYLWAISLTFGYGVVNDLVLGRPESQVRMEALVVCIVTLAVRVTLFHARPAHGEIFQRLWATAQQISRRRYARIVGVSALVFVLVMSALPIGSVEPAIAARTLERSGIGLVPGMDSGLQGTYPAYRFREVSARIEKTINERVPGDPSAVSKTSDSLARIVENVRLPGDVAEAAKLELAYLQSYETLSWIGAKDPQILRHISSAYAPGIPAMVGLGMDKTTLIMTPDATEFTEVNPKPRFFSDFAVISFGHNPGMPVPQFAIAHGDSTSVVFNNMRIEGLAQDIGNLTWTNVIFQGCLVRYHGQPVRMGNVRFLNCTFEHSPDGEGDSLLNFLSTHQGEPVSVYVP